MVTRYYKAFVFVTALAISAQACAVSFEQIVQYSQVVFIGHVDSSSAIPKNAMHGTVDTFGSDKEDYFSKAEVTVTSVLNDTKGDFRRASKIHRCADQALTPGRSYLFFSNEETYKGQSCMFITGFRLSRDLDLSKGNKRIVLITKNTYLEFPTMIPLHHRYYAISNITVDGVRRDQAPVMLETYAYLEDFMRAVKSIQAGNTVR